jgi:hypothetical protein
MATRNETIDSSSSGSGKPGGGNVSAFLGMAIVGIMLVGMLFLQASAGINL